eukprot:TRINITY_DN11814_c0_g1_i1.p1 TRINITY_DN11814_c0_g1~~TRINITY_DN11814_c0_g1_i1.p1  ORF type:complete len:315 (-),score=88.24 TRINITY_DN11814_c0_g1_i1:125-1024(-)
MLRSLVGSEMCIRDSPKTAYKDPPQTKALARARKKFEKLDVDGNGVLQGEELETLVHWLWSSFHPDGEPLSAEQQEAETSKLMGQLDSNGDAGLSFDEFGEWFNNTCASVERCRRSISAKKKTEAKVAGKVRGKTTAAAPAPPVSVQMNVNQGHGSVHAEETHRHEGNHTQPQSRLPEAVPPPLPAELFDSPAKQDGNASRSRHSQSGNHSLSDSRYEDESALGHQSEWGSFLNNLQATVSEAIEADRDRDRDDSDSEEALEAEEQAAAKRREEDLIQAIYELRSVSYTHLTLPTKRIV